MTLEFCPKRLRGNEHIFGIMYNLTYDIHVTALNVHGCIKLAFLRLRSILAFLIYFNGWSVVNFNQFFWFSEMLCAGVSTQHFRKPEKLIKIKYFHSTINIFWIIFHLF